MGKLGEKKQAKLVHPNSRKAAAIVKKKIRSARREAKKQDGHQHMRLLAERLVWFRDHLLPEKQQYTVEEVHQLINSYLSRHEAEMSELKAKAQRVPPGRRPQRQPRLEALQATTEAETREFNQGGLEGPDLTSAETVLSLRAWEGQIRLVQTMQTRKFISGRLADVAKTIVSKDHREMPVDENEEDNTDARPEDEQEMSDNASEGDADMSDDR